MIETVFVPDSNDTPQSRSKKTEDASVGEVIDFVKAYAQQETLGPLKGAGRWLGYGAGAALALGLGLLFLLIGLLRVLQTEWDRSATGSLSWLAYLITFIVTVLLLVLTIMRIKKSTLNNEPK
ncbi:MAG: hypothetical protein DRJ50_10215 [Actinobacteria bacterium]|nr:MAG: hypothetical protein DRJ50_10215 [Actinomycetota bacterium]